MKFIVIAHRNQDAPAEDFTPELMQEEAKTALGYWAADFIREIYSRTDGNGAVIVVEAANEDEVKAKLGELPLAKKGLLTADIYGVKAYRAIEIMANA